MPPSIALLLCISFILYLFALDFKREPDVSYALWVPLIWVLIIGSRAVSQWLNLGVPIESPEDYLEGSPIDRNVFIILIIVGLLILLRRGISWRQLWRGNALILSFIVYCGVSVLWSDFSVVSLKRWIKEVGTLVMVLVVLSDPNHDEAVKTVFRRCAYVLLPLSVLFIKYYPDLGRAYSPWTGEVGYSGVTVGKNSLGVLCLIFGMFFVWNFVTSSSKKGIAADKQRLLIHAIILIMIFWLFAKANSATSLVCFIIGVCMIVGSRMRILRANPRSFVRYVMVAGLIVFAFVTILDMSKTLVLNLGRDETLTGRTDLWRELVKVDINPFIGTGYESFWLGDRAAKLWQKYSFHPNQSHNGYLETYLNLGVMGLFLLAGVVVSAYRKIRQGLELDFDFGAFCLALLIIILLHNITEASFQGLSLMWFVFLLIGMEVPKPSGLQSSGFPV